MPFKDREQKLAYQRAWYAAHRKQVIAEVAKRKRTTYAGVCKSCGGPTMGSSKNSIPEWCSKPACASAQRVLKAQDFRAYRLADSLGLKKFKKGGELFLAESFRQREALKKDVSKERGLVGKTLDNARAVEPFDVGLDREEYDELLMQLRIAAAALNRILDLIEEVSNRKE